jgi:hypothetical protein
MRRPHTSKLRFWLSAAAATASIGAALTFAPTPAQAIPTVPPGPSAPTMLVRYFGTQLQITGALPIIACPGAPLPPPIGDLYGPSFLASLPCSADGGNPPKPYPFPISTDPTDPIPYGGY